MIFFSQLAGKNSHHIIEATFKAFARALRQATEYDPRRRGTVPRSVIFETSLWPYSKMRRELDYINYTTLL